MADLNPAGLATASRLNSSVNVARNLGTDSGEVGMISRFEGNCVFFMNILRRTVQSRWCRVPARLVDKRPAPRAGQRGATVGGQMASGGVMKVLQRVANVQDLLDGPNDTTFITCQPRESHEYRCHARLAQGCRFISK